MANRHVRLLASLLFCSFVHAGDAVGFLQPQQQVDEATGYVDYLVTRSGSGAGAISVDLQCSGSAVLGVDYTAPQPSTLQWLAGDLSAKTARVPILHNPAFTYGAHLTLTLANPTGGAVVTPAASGVNLTIADAEPDPVGTLVILADDPAGDVATRDDAGVLPLRVSRVGGLLGIQTCTFVAMDFDTQAGIDYVDPPLKTLSWAAGEGGTKTLDLTILPRAQARGTRTLYLLWSTGTSIPVGDGWTIAIADHLPASAGRLSLPTSIAAAETAGTATLTVGRSSGGSGAVSVQWSIVDDLFRDDTAQVGVNYGGPASGTLSWADGDTADKTISIPLIDDGVPRPTLSSCVAFASPTGGLLLPNSPVNGNPLPGQAGCMLIISDDDHQGLLGFATTAAVVDELAASVSFTVTRGSGSTGAISVDWTTGGGNATAGTDYTATSGTLNWANGDATPQTVTVPILHAAGAQLDRSFWVSLQNPVGGAGLDDCNPGHAAASVTIQDVDGGTLDRIVPSTAAVSVHETAGSIALSFVRSGSGAGPAALQIQMSAGTAFPVLQFGDPSVSTLNWQAGELGAKTLTVPIIHDGLARSPATFTVSSGVAYGNAATAAPYSTVVTILDDDTTAGATASSAAGDDGGCGQGLLGLVLAAALCCVRCHRPRPPAA